MSEFLSPTQRTEELFSQDFNELAYNLNGRVIVNPDTLARVRLTQVKPFNRESNTKGVYRQMLEMLPGELFPCYANANLLTLVVAREDGQNGACIKLERGERIERSGTTEIKSAQKITNLFGLKYKEVPNSRLAFVDATDNLYIIRPSARVEDLGNINFDISPEVVEEVLGKILGTRESK